MDPWYVFVLFAALWIAILVLRRHFSRRARTRRELAALPRTPIAEAKEGSLVKVTGRLRLLGDPLRAPLSGRPCAAWEVSVQELRSRGRSTYWHEIVREQESTEFLLEDETGRALVHAALPRMALEEDRRFRSGTFEDATRELEAFLSERGHGSTGRLGFNKQLRYREGALEEGETVSAMGLCRWEPDPATDLAGAAYREAPLRLVLEDPPDGQLLVSDAPSATS